MTQFKTREAPELHSFIDERTELKELEELLIKVKNPTDPSIIDRVYALLITYGAGLLGKAIPVLATKSPLLALLAKGLKAGISWRAKKVGVEQKGV